MMRMKMMVVNRGNGRGESFRIGVIVIDKLIFLLILSIVCAETSWIIAAVIVLRASVIVITIYNHPSGSLQLPLALEPITFMRRKMVRMSCRRWSGN